MSTRIISGPRTMSLNRDDLGHRNYQVTFLVESDDNLDGPTTVLVTPGLPLIGDQWLLGNDNDTWAYCHPDAQVKIHEEQEGDRARIWAASYIFSTRPMKRCWDVPIEDPLLEPPRVSGRPNKYTEEATHDRFGIPILTSSLELIRGPLVEFDGNRLSIQIEQNVGTALQGYVLPSIMTDCVNSAPIWGLPRRCVKLSAAPWERVFQGRCSPYYRRTLEFDVHVLRDNAGRIIGSGFDRDLIDEGTKALHGKWASGAYVLQEIPGYSGDPNPDPNIPGHFIQYKDQRGENTYVILNGFGVPAGSVIGVTGPYFVAKNRSTGQPLSDTDYWLQVVGPLQAPYWNSSSVYVPGNLVHTLPIVGLFADLYICLVANTNDFPEDSDNWLLLLQGFTSDARAPIYVGRYNATAEYEIGDAVIPPLSMSGYGVIHVEKYPEADFTLLGVPLVF